MCGIVAGISNRNVIPILIEGLKRLEYRGYDSAGIAVVDAPSSFSRLRAKGKVAQLEHALSAQPLSGTLGLAHTRWATHGKPSEVNAHPHTCRQEMLALVHNGIIENHTTLRQELMQQGCVFQSETDTEVIAHALDRQLREKHNFIDAVRNVLAQLQGAYALGIIDSREPEHLLAARQGSPLIIGLGIEENFIASDVAALLPVTRRFIFLEEGDLADIYRDKITIYHAGQVVERPVRESTLSLDAIDRGTYRHYMLKEIYEQPHAIAETLEGRIAGGKVLEAAFGPQAEVIFEHLKAVQIIACGTSYHAGLVARNWFEGLARVPCRVEVASEFRYRHPIFVTDTLYVFISQSGETADTLAALSQTKLLQQNTDTSGEQPIRYPTLAICNVPESSLVREADLVLMTRAGPEIGVASTKAFTTQLVALLMLVVAIGKRRGIDSAREAVIVEQMTALPRHIEKIVQLDAGIEKLAEHFTNKHHALFLGRGVQYPVAMEGALKLKEISYIHAEAYPAGELKHGPLALVDEDMPVIAVAPNDFLLEKLKSNLEEVRARGGELYLFSDHALNIKGSDKIHHVLVEPGGEHVSPIVFIVPLQLLAYHVAVLKGTDVDQPRNLAKSVTVE